MYDMANFFWGLYLLWSILAGVVAWHMMQGAASTWVESGGFGARFFREVFAVPCYLVKSCAKDVRDLIVHRRLEPEGAKDIPYTPGHLLRFFTGLSFIAIALIGFVFEPHQVPVWVLISNSMAVCISLAACLGHLYIRWMDRPRIWRWTVFSSIVWIMIAPFLGGLV